METNQQRLINFIKNRKLLVVLIAATLFIFASTFYYPLIYLAAATLVIGAIFLNFNEIFCMFIYASMFGCFLVPFISAIIAGFLVIIVKYIIDVRKKRIEFLKITF